MMESSQVVGEDQAARLHGGCERSRGGQLCLDWPWVPYWADVHTVHWAGVGSSLMRWPPVAGPLCFLESFSRGPWFRFLKTWEAGRLGLGKGLMSGNRPHLGAAGSSNSFMWGWGAFHLSLSALFLKNSLHLLDKPSHNDPSTYFML